MKKKTNAQIIQSVFKRDLFPVLKRQLGIKNKISEKDLERLKTVFKIDENNIITGLVENPKEAIGDTKTPHHLVPPRVLINIAWALKEGADKYGAYNFRKAGVKFHTYYSSTRRHIDAWWEGEDIDPDSGLSHIDKAIAGLIVLRDSMLENNFIDDRPNTK